MAGQTLGCIMSMQGPQELIVMQHDLEIEISAGTVHIGRVAGAEKGKMSDSGSKERGVDAT